VTNFQHVQRRPEFDKDLKGLIRRFRTLEDDLKTFVETQLPLFHQMGIDNHGIFQLPRLSFSSPKIYKAKKFACRVLKGSGVNSGIRVIYAHFDPEFRFELIEIYFKGDKENEDRRRIMRLYPRPSPGPES
jgi:hypothetical protein